MEMNNDPIVNAAWKRYDFYAAEHDEARRLMNAARASHQHADVPDITDSVESDFIHAKREMNAAHEDKETLMGECTCNGIDNLCAYCEAYWRVVNWLEDKVHENELG